MNTDDTGGRLRGAIMRALGRLRPRHARRHFDDQTIDQLTARTAEVRDFVRAYEERVAIDRRLACPIDLNGMRRTEEDTWSSTSNTAP